MPAGAKPGHIKGGGRKAGTPNKATAERALAVAQEAEDAKRSGRKLAKERLGDLADLLSGVAAYYQPQVAAGALSFPHGEDKFEKWVRLLAQVLKDLAPFQSPTFRAIAVVPPAPDDPNQGKPRRFSLTLFDTGGQRIEIATPVRERKAREPESDDA